jgi:hypothetical protein
MSETVGTLAADFCSTMTTCPLNLSEGQCGHRCVSSLVGNRAQGELGPQHTSDAKSEPL